MSRVSSDLFIKSVYDKTAMAGSAAALAIATGLSAIPAVGTAIYKKAVMNPMLNTEDTEEGKRLYQRLKEKAISQGIGVADNPWDGDVRNATNSAFMPAPGPQGLEDLEKMASNSPMLKKLVQRYKRAMVGNLVFAKPGTSGDAITSVDRADIFAHELGHAQHFHDREGSSLGNFFHNRNVRRAASLADIAGSAYLGKKVADAEAEGKEVSLARRVLAPAAVGLAAQIPILGSEYLADRRGLELLKRENASDEYMRQAKHNLRGALGAYALGSVANAGSSILTSEMARAIQARRLRKRKEKEAQRQAEAAQKLLV